MINAIPNRIEIRNESFDQLQPMSGKRPNGVRPLRPITLIRTDTSAINKANHQWRGNSTDNKIAPTEHPTLKSQIVPRMVTVVVIKLVLNGPAQAQPPEQE